MWQEDKIQENYFKNQQFQVRRSKEAIWKLLIETHFCYYSMIMRIIREVDMACDFISISNLVT